LAKLSALRSFFLQGIDRRLHNQLKQQVKENPGRILGNLGFWHGVFQHA